MLSAREHCMHSVSLRSLCHMSRYLAFIHIPTTCSPCHTNSARTTLKTSTVAGQPQETFSIAPNTNFSGVTILNRGATQRIKMWCCNFLNQYKHCWLALVLNIMQCYILSYQGNDIIQLFRTAGDRHYSNKCYSRFPLTDEIFKSSFIACTNKFLCGENTRHIFKKCHTQSRHASLHHIFTF